MRAYDQFKQKAETLHLAMHKLLSGAKSLLPLYIKESIQRWLLLRGGHCPESVSPSIDTVPLPLLSMLCTQAFFEAPIYAQWCKAFGQLPVYHRKQWEYVYICQALAERGLLNEGKHGLGFGVGREPLGSLFAKRGCRLLLTDMPSDEAHRQGWIDTYQHASLLAQMLYREICDEPTFLRAAEFTIVDMNKIPDDLTGFDFCWSSCALEHLGSIEEGLRFIKESLRCLKPGGVAVHTTEFNVSSDRTTIDHKRTVLFRKRDLERLRDELQTAGHTMQPLCLDPGSAVLDKYIDMPPYRHDKHLKLALGFYVTTSVGIIVTKAGH